MTGLPPLQQFRHSIHRGLWLVAGISVATNVLLLALPIYSLQIFDRVLLSRSIDTLWVLTVGVVLALLASVILEALRGQILMRVSNRLAVAFDRRLFEAILVRASRLGDRSLQAQRDLAALRGFVTNPQGLVAIIDAPFAMLFLCIVYWLHTWLGHAMLIGMLLLVLMAWITERLVTPLTRASAEAAQAAQRRLEGLVTGADAVAAHGMAEAAYRHWIAAHLPALVTAAAAGSVAGRLAGLAKGVRLLLNVALTGLGAYLAVRDQLTLGAMIAANIVTARALAPMELLIGAGRQLVGVRLAYGRLESMLKDDVAGPVTRLPPAQGALECERVIYLPPGSDKPTLKGISWRIAPGCLLGVIGPSAAGKSTLARLLTGVWVAKSGVVRLDGADVNTWHREDFGRACGYLPQDVQLHSGTVRENICRFSEADDEAITAAAANADAHAMIVRLPQGYDTAVGAGGAALSAGQRQRIGLARALFGDPVLIVLDEPNANLDADGVQALAHALARAKVRGATQVVISHQPSLLEHADMLLVLQEGEVRDFGSAAAVRERLRQALTKGKPDDH